MTVRWNRALSALGALVSAAVFAFLSFRIVLSASPSPGAALRLAFGHDQFGYLAIVTNVASGDLAATEPMTQTGIDHYPRAYYTAVGVVARTFALTPVMAWNLTALVLQTAMVVALAVTAARISRRWWMSLLAPLPFFAGTFSALRVDGWRTPLDSHAVLWGPFGQLFSNNAEAAGLCVIVIAGCALTNVWFRPAPSGVRIGVSLIACAAVGALSSFQTYSFISGIYLLAYIAALYFLLERRSLACWVTSLLGVVAVFIVGPVISTTVGQLPTLIFGLLPAAPGLIVGVKQSRGLIALYGLVAAVAAAPQVLYTVFGLLAGDPFLTYRVESNVDLGVIRWTTLAAALPVLLPLILFTIGAGRRRNSGAVALGTGTAIAWALLSMNDLWGANAEPYRFWLDGYLLAGAATFIVFAATLAPIPPDSDRTPPIPLGIKVVAVLVCAVLYAVASVPDVYRFQTDPELAETWNPSTPREAAIAALASDAAQIKPRSLIAMGSCIDPRTTKITSTGPIAYFYLGMAWPENVEPVARIMTAFQAGSIDPAAMSSAKAGWFLADSACGESELVADDPRFTAHSVSNYDGESITLWQFTDR